MNKARAALDAALAWTHSRARGEQKIRDVLKWLYRWGYASPFCVDLVTGTRRRGFASRLQKKGLVKITPSAAGRSLRAAPAAFVTMTPAGLEEAERHLDVGRVPLPLVDPLRINQQLLRHSEFAQRLTAGRYLAREIVDYWTEREIATGAPGEKLPDVVWQPAIDELGTYSVEIELTAKFDRRLDEFVHRSVQSLKKGKHALVLVFSDSPPLLERYRAGFAAGASYGLWERDNTRHFSRVGSKKVEQSEATRVIVRDLEQELDRLERLRDTDYCLQEDRDWFETEAGLAFSGAKPSGPADERKLFETL